MYKLTLILIVLVAFTYFGGKRVPKILKDNKQILLGVFVGVLLHSLMGNSVEGIENENVSCDCQEGECDISSEVVMCDRNTYFCDAALEQSAEVDPNLPDWRCDVARFMLSMNGADVNQDILDMGAPACSEDQIKMGIRVPSEDMPDQRIDLLSKIKQKSREIKTTKGKNYAICLLHTIYEQLAPFVPLVVDLDQYEKNLESTIEILRN